MKSQFFFPIAEGLMAFSTRLLSISVRPSNRTANAIHRHEAAPPAKDGAECRLLHHALSPGLIPGDYSWQHKGGTAISAASPGPLCEAPGTVYLK